MGYQICQRCVMDTSDPNIVFDEKGVCNHCKSAEKFLKDLEQKRSSFDLQAYIENVKKQGIGKEYDCIVGISGGVDSCYFIY